MTPPAVKSPSPELKDREWEAQSSHGEYKSANGERDNRRYSGAQEAADHEFLEGVWRRKAEDHSRRVENGHVEEGHSHAGDHRHRFRDTGPFNFHRRSLGKNGKGARRILLRWQLSKSY